jgi:hypothetical protein
MTTANSAGRIETPNGVPIYFEVHGNGEPLLLLHGFSGCSQDWLQLMRGEVSGGRYKGSESKRGLALARPVGGKIKVNPPSKPRVGHPIRLNRSRSSHSSSVGLPYRRVR